MKKILFFLLLLFNFVFASDVNPYLGYVAFTSTGGQILQSDNIVSTDGYCDSTNCSSIYVECDGSGQPPSSNYYIFTNNEVILFDTHYDSTKSDGQKICLESHENYPLLDSCPSGTIFDSDSLHCVLPPLPTCTDQQYLDTATNTCVTATSPDQLNPDGDYDGDGIPNITDTDDDGDGIPDIFDPYLGVGTSPDEPTATCSELETITQQKLACYGDNKIFNFSCSTTVSGIPFITKQECLTKVDPCIAIKSDFASSCKIPNKIEGDCQSLNYKVTSNTLKCVSPEITDDPCDVILDNLMKTCLKPSVIVGTKCLSSMGTLITSDYKCVTPDDTTDNTTDDTTDDTSDGTNESNTTSSTTDITPITTRLDKSMNHLISIEKNTLDSSNNLKSIDSKLATLIEVQKDKTALNNINSNLVSASDKLKDIKSNTSSANDKLSSISGSLIGANDSLDHIEASVKSIDEKISFFDYFSDLLDDISGISDSLYSAMDEGFNKYFNMDYTGGLASGGCASIPTLSATVYGKTITIFSQSQLDQWPMDIFRSMIIFMFVFAGVTIAFRSN